MLLLGLLVASSSGLEFLLLGLSVFLELVLLLSVLLVVGSSLGRSLSEVLVSLGLVSVLEVGLVVLVLGFLGEVSSLLTLLHVLEVGLLERLRRHHELLRHELVLHGEHSEHHLRSHISSHNLLLL